MLNFITSLFICIGSFTTERKSTVEDSVRMQKSNELDLNKIVGTWYAYKWVDDLYTGMNYDEANALIGHTMTIDSSKCTIFNNEYTSVSYTSSTLNKKEYLRQYKVQDKELELPTDSVMVVTAMTPADDPNAPVDFIVVREYLVVNYKGYFYYFSRSKQ